MEFTPLLAVAVEDVMVKVPEPRLAIAGEEDIAFNAEPLKLTKPELVNAIPELYHEKLPPVTVQDANVHNPEADEFNTPNPVCAAVFVALLEPVIVQEVKFIVPFPLNDAPIPEKPAPTTFDDDMFIVPVDKFSITASPEPLAPPEIKFPVKVKVAGDAALKRMHDEATFPVLALVEIVNPPTVTEK